jgi:putative ABC transport system permease protein
VIGTFLSQGATKKTIERILFLESIGYGIVGAILGNGLGIGGLYLINYLLSPLKDYGIVEKVNINPIFIIVGTIFAILLSLISAIIPVKRIRKLQVKEVILNNVNVSMSIGWKKFIIGAILIIISIIINFIEADWSNQVSGIMVIISIVGLIMIYPKIVDLVTNVFYKIFRGRSKVIVFSLNNLRTSKVLLGNITLIVISLLSIMLITSLGTSLKDMVTEAYTELNTDIIIGNISSIRTGDESVADKIIKELKENKNVDEETIDYSLTTFGNVGETGFVVEGINPDKYKKFNGYLELDSSKYKSFYDELSESSDNLVIITTAVQKSINKEKGDKITLKVNNIEKEFKIVGVIEGKLFNTGRVIFTKYNVLAREFKINSPDSITFSTKIDPSKVNDEIKPMLKSFGATSITKAEMEKNNAKDNQQIVDVLSIFSYLAIVIAALGVLNNIIIGFLQRKRDLAVLSSVGMAKKNRGFMLLVESVLSVVWSLIIAIPYSYLGLSLISKFLKVINMPLEIKLDLGYIPMYFIASLIVILLATIPVLFKSRKLSIITELKYE